MASSIGSNRITVLTGLNAGYETGLDKGKITIGGLAEDAIQLDGIDHSIAKFSIKAKSLKIRPVVDGVFANDGRICAKGKVAEFPLPARVQLTDDTAVFIANWDATSGSIDNLAKSALFASVVGGAVLLSPVEVNVNSSSTAVANIIGAGDKIEQTAPIEAVETKAVQEPEITCLDCADEAAGFLTGELKMRGIDDGLSVEVNEGTVRVSGNIEADHRPIWDAARMEFDRKYAGQVPLLQSIATIVDEGAPFSVSMVWLGQNKEITTVTGAKHYLGDEVQDGWLVTGIEDEYVELERADKMLRIRY